MSGRQYPSTRDDRLTVLLKARVSEDEEEYVREQARKMECGISTFVRHLVDLAVNPEQAKADIAMYQERARGRL